MAGSLNKVLLIGRLGADPDIKQMVNGKNIARFSLATSNTWKDKNTGEKKEILKNIVKMKALYFYSQSLVYKNMFCYKI